MSLLLNFLTVVLPSTPVLNFKHTTAPLSTKITVIVWGRLQEHFSKKIVDLSFYSSLDTELICRSHLQAVLLLVCHGSTVLTRSLSEFRDYLGLVYSFLVPVVDGAEVCLFLFLRSLM